jgi:hypothetical protein
MSQFVILFPKRKLKLTQFVFQFKFRKKSRSALAEWFLKPFKFSATHVPQPLHVAAVLQHVKLAVNSEQSL